MAKTRINTRSKMYWVNSKIKQKLIALGFKNIYFFPHSRFMKDYIVDGFGFDGIATGPYLPNENLTIGEGVLLFQNKSNCKPTGKQLEEMRAIGEKYVIQAAWFNYVDRKGVEVYV